ncbi:hypothetical protein DL96DRAFT_1702669 [Flagelloscypha sp. PMI_526]|nr:hypothetical protein DL96DRAFT_1702669 [Flagelloscypha sp. PMI_526]
MISTLSWKRPNLNSPYLRQRKIKRVQRDLRRIQSANAGHGQAFESILETAYGRKGRLRRELMQPLTNEPNKPQPLHPGVAMSAPLVSEVKKLRYPLFMGPIISLLTSPYSKHTGSVLKPQYIDAPPSLPPQYNPHSVEAKYLGPLSKRRERNIRHKYFVSQINKIYTPLRVDLGGAALADCPPSASKLCRTIAKRKSRGDRKDYG